MAEHAADEFVWPVPFTLEMQGCGFPFVLAANQVRLILHTVAFWLMHGVRAAIPHTDPLAKAEFTIRRRNRLGRPSRLHGCGTPIPRLAGHRWLTLFSSVLTT
jgi:hypothetical protein